MKTSDNKKKTQYEERQKQWNLQFTAEQRIAESYQWNTKKALTKAKRKKKDKQAGDKAAPIAPILNAIVKERSRNIVISSDLNEADLRKELLEIAKLRLDSLKHYHKHFWSTFKWLIVISLVLLGAPFFDGIFGMKFLEGDLPLIRILFPIATVFISLLSLVVTKIESTEVQRQYLSVRTVFAALNERYDDYPKDYFTKQPFFYYMVRYESVNMIIWIYLLVAGLAIFEIVHFFLLINVQASPIVIFWIFVGIVIALFIVQLVYICKKRNANPFSEE